MKRTTPAARRKPASRRTLALLLLGLAALQGCLFGGGDDKSVEVEGRDADLDQFRWLTGHWVGGQDGFVREEHWTHANGGTMFATAREITDGRTVFFEYLRIEKRRDGIYYVAQPNGGKPTAFQLAGTSSKRASFTNPEHDFPQRITYWRDGSQLFARVEGERNGKAVAVEVQWVRAVIPGE